MGSLGSVFWSNSFLTRYYKRETPSKKLSKDFRKEVNKVRKSSVIIFALALLLTTFTLPVMAEPTDGQKVAVTLKFTPVGGPSGDRWTTNGGVTQVRDAGLTFNLELTIDGVATPIIGESFAERDAMGKRPEMVLYHEHHVMYFPTEGGGFEGYDLLKITDMKSGTEFTLQAHGVYQGTGAFEGQTLNLWRDKGQSNPVWEGYLLKP